MTKDVAEQADTVPATARKIMSSAAFAAGVSDVRAGKPARFDGIYTDDWGYERGRQFARIAPRSMPLRNGRALNRDALWLFQQALFTGAIL
jgi:hypothetical protein